MHILLKTFLCSVAFSPIVSAFAASSTTYLSADTAIDVATGKIINQPALIIRDGRIIEFGTVATLPAPNDAKVINLKGQTLLPGLMDMHVHLTGDAEDNFLASMRVSRHSGNFRQN